MSQTSISNDLDIKYAGREAFPLTPKVNESKVVEETDGINFGRVVALAADTDKARLPRSNQAILDLDGALVASNVLAGNIVIDGVTTAYTETYATSSTATLTALAVELAALDGIASATADGAAFTITVVADAESDVYFSSGAVTGGAGQAAVALSNTESGSFYGITAESAKQLTSAGVSLYEADETASVARVNYIDVMSDDALAIGASVYVRFLEESGSADKKRGMIMASAGSSPTKAKIWSDVEVVSACGAGGFATLRINK